MYIKDTLFIYFL